ncbi:hypothetical protein GCM10027188_09150 [Lysobacter humi (ex Lee et al. 2017)]
MEPTPDPTLTRGSRYVGVLPGSEVGDPASFGRAVRFLGLMSSPGIVFMEDCTGVAPGVICLKPNNNGLSHNLKDIAVQTLPAGSMHNLLCHWQSPSLVATLSNPNGPEDRVATFRVWPFLVIANPGLALPHRTDPVTGEPLNGEIELSLARTAINHVLDTGERIDDQVSVSRTCVDGYLSRAYLKNTLGMSEAEIAAFYNSPTQLRLSLFVYTAGVEYASVQYSIRWVGD